MPSRAWRGSSHCSQAWPRNRPVSRAPGQSCAPVWYQQLGAGILQREQGAADLGGETLHAGEALRNEAAVYVEQLQRLTLSSRRDAEPRTRRLRDRLEYSARLMARRAAVATSKASRR